jgi:hypothetical protein
MPARRGAGLAAGRSKGGIAERPCVGDIDAIETDGLAAHSQRRVVLHDRIAHDVGRRARVLRQDDAHQQQHAAQPVRDTCSHEQFLKPAATHKRPGPDVRHPSPAGYFT